jgi:hypothetical protein
MFQLCACHSDTPQYNSSETFRNVPLLLSHVCPAALSFDGYLLPECVRKVLESVILRFLITAKRLEKAGAGKIVHSYTTGTADGFA